tara:strand:- start:217 stop:2028 length:1812 start_codon:yes stop_codon:yes gene_type:complete
MDEDFDEISFKRFEECGFSQKNSCFAYDYDYLMNYIDKTAKTFVPRFTSEEIKSYLSEINSEKKEVPPTQKTHLPVSTTHGPSAVPVGVRAGTNKKKRKKSKKKRKIKQKGWKRNTKKTRKKKKIKQRGGLVFFENIEDLERRLNELLESDDGAKYLLLKEDFMTCSENMSFYKVIYLNLLEYIGGRTREEGIENVYEFLFGDIGGRVSEDGVTIVANNPELRIPFNFDDIFTRGAVERTNRLKKKSRRMKSEYNNNDYISFNDSKVKYPYNLDLCTLIVWWSWVLIYKGKTFCGLTNSILRGNEPDSDRGAYKFMRVILYRLLCHPWKGLSLAKEQMRRDIPENASFEGIVSEPGGDKFLYRAEKYETDTGHWLVDQLRGNPKFQALRDNRTSILEPNEILRRIYVSQNSTISTTYNKMVAESWVSGSPHKVIYTFKGAINSRNEILEMKGSPWQIEFQGSTRQNEIVLPPCMFVIDSWSETRRRNTTTTKISIYIIRDLNGFILERIINNLGEDLNETERNILKEQYLSFFRGKSYNLSSYHEDVQSLLISTMERLELGQALTNQELTRIMRPNGPQSRDFVDSSRNFGSSIARAIPGRRR